MTKKAKRKRSNRRGSYKDDRPIAGKVIRAWRDEMGLSERDASVRLGISRGGLRSAESDGAPLYLGLACAALVKGIAPYAGPEE